MLRIHEPLLHDQIGAEHRAAAGYAVGRNPHPEACGVAGRPSGDGRSANRQIRASKDGPTSDSMPGLAWRHLWPGLRPSVTTKHQRDPAVTVVCLIMA